MRLHFLSSCGLDGTVGWPLIIRSCTSPSVLDKTLSPKMLKMAGQHGISASTE